MEELGSEADDKEPLPYPGLEEGQWPERYRQSPSSQGHQVEVESVATWEGLMGDSGSPKGDTAIGRAFAKGREKKGEIAWPLLFSCPLVFCQ